LSETVQPFELHLERALDAPLEQVAAALHEGPARWLPGFRREGERQTAELTWPRMGSGIARRIEVETGPVQRFAYGLTVHVRWKAATHAELYPELDGHLRVEGRKPSGSSLRFDARYIPPGGRLGATVDRTVMHRVAEGSVEDFLERVSRLLAAG
jgi:hypothetical protein